MWYEYRKAIEELDQAQKDLKEILDLQEEVFQMLLVEATVARNGAVQATAQMKIALTDTDAANEQR